MTITGNCVCLESENKFSTYVYTVVKNAMLNLCIKGLSSFEKHLWDDGIVQVFLDENPIDDDGLPLVDKISDGQKDPTAKRAVLNVMLEKMRNRLALLPERERRLLAYHYGLGTLTCKTISETAAFFHLTENYMKIIEKGALKKLRDGMNDGKIV